MRISRTWLSDYVDFDDLSAEKFCELITTRVAEVDRMYQLGAAAESATIVLVKAVNPHPKRPNLSIATVQLGTSEVEVVCGAPNVKAGMHTLYLAPGAKFVSSKGEDDTQLATVEVREVDGVKSCGVLVSERELGLTGDHSGIIEVTPEWLHDSVPNIGGGCGAGLLVGKGLNACFAVTDTVLEIDNKSLTHRPDLWCHFGFARELSAILDRPLKDQMDRFADDDREGEELLKHLGSGKSAWKIDIAKACGCRRFTGLEIADVTVEQSPLWMRRRLFAVGAGVRNVIVDLSNYVMHDIGQPNHTYDADKLQGDTIFVRRAADSEKFLGLDGYERELTKEDLVIADQSGPIGMGGVIGGGPSAITDGTKRLLLEIANFDPVVVRRTTVRHALRTDASNRYEKSLSAFGCAVGQQRFAGLLKSLQPRVKFVGSVADSFPERPATVGIALRHNYIRERLGADVKDAAINRMLTGLGFGLSSNQSVLSVPFYRATRDISIEDDLVEEIGRIYGYENVPEQAPKITSIAAPLSRLAEFERWCRDTLCGIGFSEAYHYSFVSAEFAQSLGYDMKSAVELRNPIDSEQAQIRTSLIPGMVRSFTHNARHTLPLLVFEQGRGYDTQADPRHAALKYRLPVRNPASHERRLLALTYAGGAEESEIGGSVVPPIDQGADFYAVTSVLDRLVQKVARSAMELAPLEQKNAPAVSGAGEYRVYKPWMHPYRAAAVVVNGHDVGVVAELSPRFREGLDARAVLVELDLELLLEADNSAVRYVPLSKYPDSFFEISVVAPKHTHFTELKQLVERSVPGNHLRRADVIAVYEGKPLAEGQKSVSFKLFLGAEDRTLSSEELTAIQNGVMAAVEGSKYSLRR